MTTEAKKDLSFIAWPWPTHIELQQCWYICSTCWGFDLTLDLHRKHREKYHPELVRQEGYRLKDSLITFIDDALTCHNEWSEGTSPISQCYQDRIAGLKKSASRNLVTLDDASAVFKFVTGGIYEAQTPYADKPAKLIESQKSKLDEILLRIRDNHVQVYSMLESDSEVENTRPGKENSSKFADEDISQECKAVFSSFLKNHSTSKEPNDSHADMKTIEAALANVYQGDAAETSKTGNLEVHSTKFPKNSESEMRQRGGSCNPSGAGSSVLKWQTVSADQDGPATAANSRRYRRSSSSYNPRPKKQPTRVVDTKKHSQKGRSRPKKRSQTRQRRDRKVLSYFKR